MTAAEKHAKHFPNCTHALAGTQSEDYAVVLKTGVRCRACSEIFNDDCQIQIARTERIVTSHLVDLEVIRQMIKDLRGRPGGEAMIDQIMSDNRDHPDCTAIEQVIEEVRKRPVSNPEMARVA